MTNILFISDLFAYLTFQPCSTAQKAVYCPMGKVTSIRCATVDGIASYSTGEIQQCTLETGFRCMNDNNFPATCSD
ncbi:hypothetical protein DPMN_064277 [Dreissena polymorpha]|uniref:Uncharacterized protein n=1 Tax=Dreissena polymorpha TaxID=45954 RepID=A0A9D4HKX6_DREPO|nr:hypothetical protein DPMN_064277 [Dreissena polymorpha]